MSVRSAHRLPACPPACLPPVSGPSLPVAFSHPDLVSAAGHCGSCSAPYVCPGGGGRVQDYKHHGATRETSGVAWLSSPSGTVAFGLTCPILRASRTSFYSKLADGFQNVQVSILNHAALEYQFMFKATWKYNPYVQLKCICLFCHCCICPCSASYFEKFGDVFVTLHQS